MIDIKYILTENDFLQLNLYYFKTEGKLKKLILKTWIAYSIIIAMLIGFLFYETEISMGITLVVVYVAISVLHSGRMKYIYLKCFKKSIKAYESRFDKEVRFKVSESQLHIESIAGNTNLNLSQLDSISETQSYFFIKLKIEVVVIPKSGVEDVISLKHHLVSLTEKLHLKYYQNLKWKW